MRAVELIQTRYGESRVFCDITRYKRSCLHLSETHSTDSREPGDITSDFDDIVAKAKDCGILFVFCCELRFRIKKIKSLSRKATITHVRDNPKDISRSYILKQMTDASSL